IVKKTRCVRPIIPPEIPYQLAVEETGRLQVAGRRESRSSGSIAAAILGSTGRNHQRSVGGCAEVEVAVVAYDDVEGTSRSRLNDGCHRPVAEKLAPEVAAGKTPALICRTEHKPVSRVKQRV